MEHMTQNTVKVTPQMAQEYLEKSNFKNRNVRTNVVKAYARDMECGKWKKGSTISFDTNGNVIDGQHRLRAVILSGTAQYFYLRHGVKAEDAIFDMGANRNIADVIQMTNPDIPEVYKDKRTVSFITSLISKDLWKKVTLADIVAYIDKYDEMMRPFIDRILSQKTRKPKIGAMPTMTGLYLAYVNGVSLDEIDYFYKIFKSGYGTCEKDIPIIATRQWFYESLLGGGRDVKSHIIDRMQFGLRQYLNGAKFTGYRPPKNRIWVYPDEPLFGKQSKKKNGEEVVVVRKTIA